MLRKLFHRLRASLRRGKTEREMERELRFHLEMETAENTRRGTSEEEARRAALRSFGGVEQVKEAYRDLSRFRWVEEIWQDARYGARMLRTQPGFTIVAALTLSLGIGANTAIFSVVNALVFNPLPYPDPQRLVWVTNVFRGDELIGSDMYSTFQAESKTFDHLAAYESATMNLSGQGEPEQVNYVRATASVFPAIGVAPRLGRTFTPEEDQPGAPPVAVLSHDYWRRRFGGDPSIVGQSFTFGRESWQVVGVMPPGIRFLPEHRIGGKVDVWIPYALDKGRDGGMIIEGGVFGRLKPGASIEQAQSELDLLLRPFIQAHPEMARRKASRPFAAGIAGAFRLGRVCPADRMRKRDEPVAGARELTPERVGDSVRPGRGAQTTDTANANRKPALIRVRRRGRIVIGAVERQGADRVHP